jgi:hypothetical protein
MSTGPEVRINSVAWIVKTSPLSNLKLLKDNPLKNKKRKITLTKDSVEDVMSSEETDTDIEIEEKVVEEKVVEEKVVEKFDFSSFQTKTYISMIPVEPEEIIEDKMIELMETFVDRNGNPNKDKNFWIRNGHLYNYDGWTWRTTKEGIVFKFYRKGASQDIYSKPLFIGILLEATTMYKTSQNFHKFDGNLVFAKDCFSKNKDFKKWIEKLGLLPN